MLNLAKTKTLEQENAISTFCAKRERWKFECKSSKALVVRTHKTINFFAIVCISGWTWRDAVVFRVFANIEPSIAWQILGLTQRGNYILMRISWQSRLLHHGSDCSGSCSPLLAWQFLAWRSSFLVLFCSTILNYVLDNHFAEFMSTVEIFWGQMAMLFTCF